MNRILPHPILSAGLVLIWLMLNRFSLGHLVLGTAISIGAGLALHAIEPERIRLRRPLLMVKLFFIVGGDIIRSNIAVASLILANGKKRERKSGFIEVKLRLRDPQALAVLAMILTATPGSAWMEHDTDSGILLLHIFDLKPEEDWQELIQNRYEALLLEIFA